MTSRQFRRSDFDSCVYFGESGEGCFVYFLLYIDDMIIAVKNIREIRKVKESLAENSK